MHVVSDDCTSIFFFFLFSVESRRARITGLVNALSDHFTSFFVTWEQSLLCPQEGSPVSAFVFDHFSFNPAPRSTAVPGEQRVRQDLQMKV